MLKAIERATRQPIEPIGLPTRGEVAERRVAQFKQQLINVLAEENLDFFYEVVRRMEGEENLATRQIAAGLAFLAQRERPLQPEGFDAPSMPASPAAQFRAERPERGERPERPQRSEREFERAPRAEFAERAEPAERPERKERKERPAPRDFGASRVVRYRIEVGRNQGALPKEIVGAIANEGGIEGRLIGQINLFDDYSTVELPELPPELLDTLKRTRVRQLPLKIRLAEPGEGEKRGFSSGERRPASADFSARPRRDFKDSASADFQARPRRDFKDAASQDFPARPRRDTADVAKPPYRSDKKPTGVWQGKGSGKPFGKPPGKKRPD